MKPDITKYPNLASHKKENDFKFKEYETIEENERIISIEYCANCEDHKMHTMHCSEAYFNAAKLISQAIKLRFPSIRVLLKPIDTHIIRDFRESYKKIEESKNINDKYNPVRIGALEVKMAINKKDVVVLHSKLETNFWPNIMTILNKIPKYTPLVKINLKLFNSDDKLPNECLDGIMVNLYQMNIPEIDKVKRIYNENLKLVSNPKGLITFMKAVNHMTSSNLENEVKPLPFSKSFYNSLSITNPKNKLPSLVMSLNSEPNKISEIKKPIRRNVSNTEIASKHNYNEEFVYIKTKIAKYKGKLLEGNFKTNEKGIIEFKDLPYDSYFVEVVENKNVATCGAFIRNNEKLIKKFIPIKKQNEAYIVIFVMTKENNEEVHLQDVNVTIKLVSSNVNDDDNKDQDNEEVEDRIKVPETKGNPSSYDIVVPEGKYLMEVKKEGFEDFKKVFTYINGENPATLVYLNTSKVCDYEVSALKFTDDRENPFKPLANCLFKLHINNNSNALEGVSNNKGLYLFKNIRDDLSVNVSVEKDGYYTVIREFLGDLDTGKTRRIQFILIKKSYINEQNCFLLVYYSNLNQDIKNPNIVFDFESDEAIHSKLKVSNPYLLDTVTIHKIKMGKYILNKDFFNFDNSQTNEIVRLVANVENHILLKNYELNNKERVNGMNKYSNQIYIYSPHDFYQVIPPKYSRLNGSVWDIGFIDVKNYFFFELGQMIKKQVVNKQFFHEWICFIELIIKGKVYNKLFEFFGFKGSKLIGTDRYLHENEFINVLETIFLHNDEYKNSRDFFYYACDLFKSSKGKVSYITFKSKIASNLKNFRDMNFTY